MWAQEAPLVRAVEQHLRDRQTDQPDRSTHCRRSAPASRSGVVSPTARCQVPSRALDRPGDEASPWYSPLISGAGGSDNASGVFAGRDNPCRPRRSRGFTPRGQTQGSTQAKRAPLRRDSAIGPGGRSPCRSRCRCGCRRSDAGPDWGHPSGRGTCGRVETCVPVARPSTTT